MDFQGYLSIGIFMNQRLLGLQKLDGTFFQSHRLAFFLFLNFVMSDTKLFDKSIPGKRLLFKHAFLILAEASKTTWTQLGLFIFNTMMGYVLSDRTCLDNSFRRQQFI